MRLKLRKTMYLVLLRARDADGEMPQGKGLFTIVEFWRVQVDRISMTDRNVDKSSKGGTIPLNRHGQ